MRVLGVLAAWGVLAVLATLCFAVGGSIGYRRGVQDAVQQLRERRGGGAGCRTPSLPHHQRRPTTRMRHVPRVRSVHGSAHGPQGAVADPSIARQRRLSAVAAAVVVCMLAVPGVAVGATTAQPGDGLWQVKRTMERTRLALAIGPDSDMQIHVELASRRIGELHQLLNGDAADSAVVDTVIADLQGHTEAAIQQLKEVEAADRPELVERIEGTIARQVAFIDVLMEMDCAAARAERTCLALDDTRAVAMALANRTALAAAPPPSASAGGTDVAETPTARGVSSAATTSEAGSASAAPSAPPDEPGAGSDEEPAEPAAATSAAPPTDAAAATPPSAAPDSDGPAADVSTPSPTGPSPSADTAEGAATAATSVAEDLGVAAEQVTDSVPVP